ncbi:MAG: hypothetical protein FWF98_00770 [Dehalococcoidia bacterium]|nr:hypothetical protein [Dehalococcoidia bacterium]
MPVKPQYLIGGGIIERFGRPEVWKLEDISVLWYVGNYSRCEVVYMECLGLQYTQTHYPVKAAGYTIIFGTSHEAYVHNDSNFYTINEAYDAKLITKSDVYNIGKKLDPDFTERNPK